MSMVVFFQFGLVQAPIYVEGKGFRLQRQVALFASFSFADGAKQVAGVIILKASVRQLETHFPGTLIHKVVNLLGFQEVADCALKI